MNVNIQQSIAIAALCCVSAAHAAAPVAPGGYLGDLSLFPAQFASGITTDASAFGDAYLFNLTADSDVHGSVSALSSFLGQALSPLQFAGISIDGAAIDWSFGGTTGYDISFSAKNLSSGLHFLVVSGLVPTAPAAYSGSIYAKAAPQVPEPSTLAIALAGVAVVAGLRARRKAD